ncbi:CheY-like chemotaxis protein [Tenacibaculum adriaticum]|uniref:CheY-like chemotaxis protein n=2 Tax=Tenacibaculum adriaticum TaxID=413713 RepID=A0A5S5DNU8_9FLAO|nr:CheY-like chemotaxis protein [Tenacibaculum adriaticum]
MQILLIEDDEIEIMKFHRTISKLKLKHQVIEARNGEEALQILSKKDRLPHIILLDLNMPKINGIEFLNILKKDSVLKYIPTIVLSTSNNYKDMLECYKIGIAGYVVKPLKYEEYKEKMLKILSYWSINELISV